MMKRRIAALIVLVLVVAIPVWAAIAFVAQEVQNSTSSPITPTGFMSSATNDYVFGIHYFGSGNNLSVTFSDTGGDTFTNLPVCNVASDGDSVNFGYALVVSGLSNKVTGTDGSGTGNRFLITPDFSGLATSLVLDQTGTCVDTTGVASITTTVTTTAANELLIQYCGDNQGSSSWSADAGNGFTALTVPNGSGPLFAQYKIVSSTGTYNAVCNPGVGASGNEIAGVLVSFSATPITPGTNIPRLTLVGVGQ